MEKWEKALDTFIQEWMCRDEVEGLLVCGSYVTGTPSKRSDIDLHIILSKETEWRQRGNKIINGYLIEYFANPPDQIREYFREEHAVNRRHAPHQFVSGRIILDKTGTLQQLRNEAAEWMKKEYLELNSNSVELFKYGLWDTLDNLHDAYKKESGSFTYAYWSALISAVDFYSRYMKYDTLPPHKIHELLNELAQRVKYALPDYPDAEYKELLNEALLAKEKVIMLQCYERIVTYIQERAGGFNINGWQLRTPVHISPGQGE